MVGEALQREPMSVGKRRIVAVQVVALVVVEELRATIEAQAVAFAAARRSAAATRAPAR